MCARLSFARFCPRAIKRLRIIGRQQAEQFLLPGALQRGSRRAACTERLTSQRVARTVGQQRQHLLAQQFKVGAEGIKGRLDPADIGRRCAALLLQLAGKQRQCGQPNRSGDTFQTVRLQLCGLPVAGCDALLQRQPLRLVRWPGAWRA